MEAAGLALATISLIVTALEKYAETLETIRLFATDRYRRYLERYSHLLGAQQASLVNAIEIALAVKISEEDITDILNLPDSTGSVWKDRALQAKLRKNLGRDYDTFMNIIGEVQHVLQGLNHSLEKDVSIPVGWPPGITCSAADQLPSQIRPKLVQ